MIPDRATVQLARGKADTVSGTATVLIKVPTVGRKISGGLSWFGTPHPDDYLHVMISDEDNLLGYGAGATIASYTDTGVPSANQGWFIPPSGFALVERLVEFGNVPGGLYVKIVGTKGDGSSDTLRVNLHWGQAY
jgi:hypothetical protein